MTAVVLAAGRGTRLDGSEGPHPKALLRVGSETLLARHARLLGAARVDSITVVAGHQAGEVAAAITALRAPVLTRVVVNPRYEEGSALSLLAGLADAPRGSALVLDADLLYGPGLLARLLAAPHPTCALADSRSADTGEEVKVAVGAGDRVIELGKRLRGAGRVVGESVGIYRFARDAAAALAAGLREVTRDEPTAEYEHVINGLLAEIPMGYVSVGDEPWIEIDFPADVERAREEVYPALRAREGDSP